MTRNGKAVPLEKLEEAVDEKLDAQSESAPEPQPATDKKPLPEIERIRQRREEVESKLQAAKDWHDDVSVQWYRLDAQVKSLKKDRDEAVGRVSSLMHELEYLEREEQEVKDAPPGLFADEVSQEWRELPLSRAGIDAELESEIDTGGLNTLGALVDAYDSGHFDDFATGDLEGLLEDFFAANPRYKRQMPAAPAADDAWKTVPMSGIFDGGILKALTEAGIDTVGALAAYTAEGKPLTDIKGIGAGKADNIEERMAEWWAEHPQFLASV